MVQELKCDEHSISVCLTEIRRAPQKRAQELVNMMEDASALKEVFHHTDISSESYTDSVRRFDNFCNLYVKHIFERFIKDPDDVMIMLAIYKYLPKYAHITKLEERRDTFAREYYEPRHPEKRWGEKPSDKSRGILEEENRIICSLSEVLAELTLKRGGKLNLIKDVLAEMDSDETEILTNPDETESGAVPSVIHDPTIAPKSLSLSPNNDSEGEAPSYDPEADDNPEPDPEPEPSPKEEHKFIKIMFRIVGCVAILIGMVAFIKFLLPIIDNINPTSSVSPTNNVESIPSTDENDYVDIDKWVKCVVDEDMEKLVLDAQSSIAVYDDNGDYDTQQMYSLVRQRIFDNPMFGDMVALGLFDTISSMESESFQPYYDLLSDFLSETDSAMENPKEYQEGMRRWLVKRQGIVSTTDEYKDYMHSLILALSHASGNCVFNLRSTGNWHIESDTTSIFARAEKATEKTVQLALIFWSHRGDGSIEWIMGISVDDGSILVCNPKEWDLDSFIEPS